MKQLLLLVLLTLSVQCSKAQKNITQKYDYNKKTQKIVRGQLKAHAGQQVTLTGFNYYKSYELATSTLDSLGNFILTYPKTYKGLAILKTADNSSLVTILTEPNIELKTTHLRETDSLVYTNSIQNNIYINFAKNKKVRESAWSALKFLQPLYLKKQELKNEKNVATTIDKEIIRIEQKNKNVVKQLNDTTYLKWFIPYKQLVNDMPKTYNRYVERIPENIQQFRNINFNNPNFKTSGLFKELIEGHYMLLENMGQSQDSIYIQMNMSTNYLINNLKENDSLLNTVSENLFKLFEKRSLFPAAANLSNKLLADNTCVLNNNLANTMQRYVTLKVGNIAPDIQLTTNKLSDIKKPVLLVFGASDCPHCKDGALELLKYYDAWKAKKDVEVVYISLDTDKKEYEEAYKNAPWQMFCDYKGFKTKAAKDFFVNATPTYILLDKNLKILVHPSTLGQVNAWVDYRM